MLAGPFLFCIPVIIATKFQVIEFSKLQVLANHLWYEFLKSIQACDVLLAPYKSDIDFLLSRLKKVELTVDLRLSHF